MTTSLHLSQSIQTLTLGFSHLHAPTDKIEFDEEDLVVKATLLGHISSLEEWTAKQMSGEKQDLSSYGNLSLGAILRLFRLERSLRC